MSGSLKIQERNIIGNTILVTKACTMQFIYHSNTKRYDLRYTLYYKTERLNAQNLTPYIFFSSTLPLLIFYFNSIDLMLPYSLTLAGYSSITVPYWELLVVVSYTSSNIPKVRILCSQAGNVLFPRWGYHANPLLLMRAFAIK